MLECVCVDFKWQLFSWKIFDEKKGVASEEVGLEKQNSLQQKYDS